MGSKHQEQRESSRDLKVLSTMLAFVAPYRWRVVAALLALICTAAVTLSLGQGLRLLVDEGFTGGSSAGLNHALLVFMGLVLLLAVGTFTRFYIVSWIGGRV